MEPTETGTAATWVPAACTLPPAERLRRAAEFDRLFAAAVCGIERAGPTRLRLDLRPGPQVAARTAELAAAETGCCSFFTFTITIAASRLVLDINLPASHAGLLDDLAVRAAAAAGAA